MIMGDRVRLRAIQKDDLPLFTRWLNDPEVQQGLMHYLPFSIHDEEDWFEQTRKRPQDERPMTIEIITEKGWLPVGDCGLFNYNWRVRSAEFGIFIGAKEYWDQGYGTDVVNLILKHGFGTLNLNRISLDVFDNNPRAIRTYEKTGFILEGRKRQAHYHDGKHIDILLMSILRDDWLERI